MTRYYRQGIKGILSLGPTPTKPRIIKSEPNPYEDLFSLDTPVDLTPLATPKVETKVTPKIKKEGPMQRYKRGLRWITRPKTSAEDIKKLFNEETATDNELYAKLKNDPLRYTQVMGHKYDGKEPPKDYPRVTEERFNDKILQRDKYEKKTKPHLMWNGKEHVDINDPNYMKEVRKNELKNSNKKEGTNV